MIKRVLIMSLLAPVLTGCAVGHTSFDCGKTSPARCQSLSKIDKLVSQGRLKQHKYAKVIRPKSYRYNKPNYTSKISLPTPRSKHPLRASETVMRVWVAPFVDKQGDYHQPEYVYRVMKPGFWVGNPVKAVSDPALVK